MRKSNSSPLIKQSVDFKVDNLLSVSPFTAAPAHMADEQTMSDEPFEVKNVLRNAANEQNQRCNYRAVSVSFSEIGRQTNCYLRYFLMRARPRMEMALKLRGLAVHIQTLFWIQRGMLGRKPIFPFAVLMWLLWLWANQFCHAQPLYVYTGHPIEATPLGRLWWEDTIWHQIMYPCFESCWICITLLSRRANMCGCLGKAFTWV